MGGFASDRLGMRRCMGGPQMLRGPKLQKWASDPGWAQNGGFQNCTPKIGPSGVTCPWAQNGGVKAPPCGPLWGQLPIVWFWAPEGQWGWGIGKGGMERPTVCIFGRASPQKRVALRASPGLAAARLAGMLLCSCVI